MVRPPATVWAPERPSSGGSSQDTASLEVDKQLAPFAASGVQVGDKLADRFQLTRRLGEGGMGVVFCAHDLTQPGSRVALKVLDRLAPAAIYRLKSEFRSLADVSHPNLVALHELFSHDGHWFFTMELVEGTDFYRYVRNPDAAAGKCACDLDRLSAALRQLCVGARAIHAAGKLHRDLKPSNVLVDQRGRVVLVDFGLVRDRDPLHPGVTDAGFVGTPAYAAPEQVDPRRVSPALDWYAVGVMLYEALTGRLPFQEDGSRALISKRSPDSLVPPSERVQGVPEELDSLCMRLLATDPEKRADGSDVLRALACSEPPEPPRTTSASPSSTSQEFVGREPELAELQRAFDAVCRGEQACVMVSGASGAGKTRMVEQFLAGLKVNGEAATFSSRCYSHEQLPYKAFDAAIDQLTAYLSHLPTVQSAALLPRDTRALTQVFPVLNRVASVGHVPPRVGPAPNEQQLRERAFGALKQLLGAVADHTPVVLVIDDLQWADPDSGRLLKELLSNPDAPALMVIATYRAEERTESALLRELYASEALSTAREIHLEPLSQDQSRALAAQLVRQHGVASDALVDRIVTECQGHPLFLTELARHLAAHPDTQQVSLDDALGARTEQLSFASLELLRLICVAGHPVSRSVLSASVGGANSASWTELRASRLVRSRAVHGDVLFEAYHDRLREEVTRRLPVEARQQLHRRLATAYANSAPADSRAVVEHYVAAGAPEEAVPFASAAAQDMAETLAFGAAIQLLRLVLQHTTNRDERVQLRLRLIDLLVANLEAKSAADLCIETADELPAEQARDLRRRAMELYLGSSHQREGYALLTSLCREARLGRPKSRWMSMLRSLPWAIWMLLIDGPSLRVFERARRGPPDPDEHWRGWLAWSAYLGVMYSDYTLSAYYAMQVLRLAPRSGDPELFALASGHWEMLRHLQRGDALRGYRSHLEQLIVGMGEYVRSWLRLHRASTVAYAGHFGETLDILDATDPDASGGSLGMSSASFLGQQGRMVALFWLGRATEFRRCVVRARRAAFDSDDRNFMYRFQLWSVAERLTAGDLAGMFEAHDRAHQLGESFGNGGQTDPWWHAIVYLASDQGVLAAERMRETTRSYRWTLDSGMRINRLLLAFFQGLADARAFAQSGRPHHLRSLRRNVRHLERLRYSLQPPMHAQLRGHLALAQGRTEEAITCWERAIAGYDARGHAGQAAALRYRLGGLLGPDQGTPMQQLAEAELAELGHASCEMWTRVFAPAASA